MGDQIIGIEQWLSSPLGRYLLDWESAQLDRAVVDIFGFHALQLGIPALDGLRANRMPHRWLAQPVLSSVDGTTAQATQLVCDFAALPFPGASLDLVVMPHTLEYCPDPHATLREVERVLVPEGRVVLCGLNPISFWGLRQQRVHWYRRVGLAADFLPEDGVFIGYWRLRDWLRLLGFDMEVATFGCYRPALTNERWLQRFAWMEGVGTRWWPFLGAAYFLVAVKRVRGMRLIGPSWRAATVRTQPVSIANKSRSSKPSVAPRADC